MLSFTDAEVWSDLRAGTIITVAETDIIGADGTTWSEDLSYGPSSGDWWIHLVAGSDGSGTAITAADFGVSNDDWQTDGVRRPGASTVRSRRRGHRRARRSGIGNTQIGELEERSDPAITPRQPYDDGDQSTFGEPNEFAGTTQDLEALRPDLGLTGDVDCGTTVDIVDALFIAQYVIGVGHERARSIRAVSSTSAHRRRRRCTVTIVDALLIAQCVAGIDNGWCDIDGLRSPLRWHGALHHRPRMPRLPAFATPAGLHHIGRQPDALFRSCPACMCCLPAFA